MVLRLHYLMIIFAVFRNDHIDIFPDLPAYPVGALSSSLVRRDRVEQLLNKIQPHKSSGCDNVSNTILKCCASSLSIPLTSIVQKSLNAGVFPTIWKSTNICPIHKGFSNISFTPANIVKNSGKNCCRKHSGTHISCGV